MLSLQYLHSAIEAGDVATIRHLLVYGADVNATYSRETACTRAIDRGSREVIKFLINHESFEPNTGNQFDRTPLYFAAKEGYTDFVVRLLDRGSDVNQADIRGITPLGASAWYNRPDVITLLLEAGANINQADVVGETPLFRACAHGNLDVVKVLLHHNCDVNRSTNRNHNPSSETPLMTALPSTYNLRNKHVRMRDLVEIVRQLIRHGADLNAVDSKGKTAVSLCAFLRRPRIHAMCLLVEAGCDINKSDSNGLSPFHLALRDLEQRDEFGKYLLMYGCGVDIITNDKNKNGIVSWAMEIENNNTGSIENKLELFHLIANAASPYNILNYQRTMTNSEQSNACRSEMMSCLAETELTLQSLCRFVIRKCIGENAIVKTEQLPIAYPLKRYLCLGLDYHRYNPVRVCELHDAIMDNDSIGSIRKILDKGVAVDAMLYSRLPLTLAAGKSRLDIIDLLLARGGNPLQRDHTGQTPFHAAAKSGRADVIRRLIVSCMQFQSTNLISRSPLLEIASSCDFNTMRLIIAESCQANVRYDDSPAGIHYDAEGLNTSRRTSHNSERTINLNPLYGNNEDAHIPVVHALLDSGGESNS